MLSYNSCPCFGPTVIINKYRVAGSVTGSKQSNAFVCCPCKYNSTMVKCYGSYGYKYYDNYSVDYYDEDLDFDSDGYCSENVEASVKRKRYDNHTKPVLSQSRSLYCCLPIEKGKQKIWRRKDSCEILCNSACQMANKEMVVDCLVEVRDGSSVTIQESHGRLSFSHQTKRKENWRFLLLELVSLEWDFLSPNFVPPCGRQLAALFCSLGKGKQRSC